MENFRLQLEFKAPPEAVYEALTGDGPRGWWTRFCETGSSIGDRHHFRFPKAGFFAEFVIEKQEANRLVEWRCIDSRHPKDSGWVDLKDWVGTTVRFEIEPAGGGSRLKFEHQGLTPDKECFGACRSAWSGYLGRSLRRLVESGEGEPYSDDSEDNL